MGGNIELSHVTEEAEPTASIRVKYTPNLKPLTIEAISFQERSTNYL